MDSNGNCVCNPGYIKSGDGQCNKACGINENMNFYGACNCNDGFTRAGNGTCYKRCPANAIMDYNGNCNCIAQYQKQADGTCKYIQCKSDEYWDGTKCKTTNCGLGGYLDTSGSIWVCRCSAGYSLDFNGVCQPIPGYNSSRAFYDSIAFNKFLMNSGMG